MKAERGGLVRTPCGPAPASCGRIGRRAATAGAAGRPRPLLFFAIAVTVAITAAVTVALPVTAALPVTEAGRR